MKNLVGVKEADVSIQEELYLAGIDVVKGKGPCSIVGRVGIFTFSRARTYWRVSVPEGEGLPLDVAKELHERKYPISGEGQPKIYGQVVRVVGHYGCPPPSEWAKHYDAKGLELLVDPEGKRESEFKLLLKNPSNMKPNFRKCRFVPNLDGVVEKSVVDSYHIDSQVGLNEFARVVKEL